MITAPSPSLARNNPELFASLLLKIKDKRQRLILLQYNQAQRHYLKNATRRDLILKARQFGFSTMFQAELFRLATTRRVTTATLGNDDENTQKLRRIMQCFVENIPRELELQQVLDNARIMTIRQTGSQLMTATAGNRNAGRGGTYSHIHGSEVAFWVDAESIMASTMQGGNPAIALESTPNGAQGWFYERCMEALDGNRDWKLHFYPWWWGEDYQLPLDPDEEIAYTDDEATLAELYRLTPEQIKWRRWKQRELRHFFPQEYPEDPKTCFLLSGASFFGNLDGVFTAPFGAEYNPDHKYFGGLDWGQSDDYTFLSIGDKTTKQQVDLLRMNKLPWATMRERVAERCAYWRVEMLYAEKNSASSNVEDISALYPNTEAFETNNDTKTRAVNGLYGAVHEDGWKLLPDPDQKREMQAFQAKQTTLGAWTFSAPSGEHDDTVIGNMLMIHGATRPEMGEWMVVG